MNRMLVWRTLKRYKESGNVQNQPGQGRARSAIDKEVQRNSLEKSEKIHLENSKESSEKSDDKRGECFVWTMFTVLVET